MAFTVNTSASEGGKTLLDVVCLRQRAQWWRADAVANDASSVFWVVNEEDEYDRIAKLKGHQRMSRIPVLSCAAVAVITAACFPRACEASAAKKHSPR